MCVRGWERLRTWQHSDCLTGQEVPNGLMPCWEGWLELDCGRGSWAGTHVLWRSKDQDPARSIPQEQGSEILFKFCLCVCVCVCLKLGPLLLNMERALKCDPEVLSPGSLCGQPLTFHGVHDVALLEVSQFGFLHHHCKTKHLGEASWAASRRLISPHWNLILYRLLLPFWVPAYLACGIWVPWTGIEPGPPSTENTEP